MKQKTFFTLTSSIFGVIALLHLFRSAFAWQVTVNGIGIPMWISWIGVIVAGYLSYLSYTTAK